MNDLPTAAEAAAFFCAENKTGNTAIYLDDCARTIKEAIHKGQRSCAFYGWCFTDADLQPLRDKGYTTDREQYAIKISW